MRNVVRVLGVLCVTLSAPSFAQMGSGGPVEISRGGAAALSGVVAGEYLTVEVFGRRFELLLEQNPILAPDLRVVEIGEGGRETELSVSGTFYRGTVAGEPNSWVRLTIRDGRVSGLIRVSEDVFVIEPPEASIGAALSGHVGYRASEIELDEPVVCGVEEDARTRKRRRRHQRRRRMLEVLNELPKHGASLQGLAGGPSNVEMSLVGDYQYFSAANWPSGSNAQDWMVDILNEVDGIYQTQIGITFVVPSITIYSTPNDPFDVADDLARGDDCTPADTASDVLAELRNLRRDVTSLNWHRSNNDMVHLFTGRELCTATTDPPGFSHGTIGLAYIGTVCSSWAVGVSEDFSTNLASMTTLLAHELGHNFNAYHYNPGCWIMRGTVGGCGTQDMFSGPTVSTITSYVDGLGCLDTEPTSTPTPTYTNTPTHTPTPTNTVVLPANAAEFVRQNVPATMQGGESYSVSVTYRNTGQNVWQAGAYVIGSWNSPGNRIWGKGRFPMDAGAGVQPGEEYTYAFTITAPTQSGIYDFQWKNLNVGVEWFGDLSQNVQVRVIASAIPNAAEFVEQSVPTVMQAGSLYDVSITMRNVGSNTWTRSTHMLGSWNPVNNRVWGFGRVRIDGGASVEPGESYTYSFAVRAPSTTGTYDFQWKNLNVGVEWFDSLTSNVSVQVVTSVAANAAEFVEQNVPAVMEAGAQYSVSVTMKNVGSNPWTRSSHMLGSWNPVNNRHWGFGRVRIAEGVSVGFGQTYTYEFVVTAPASSGTYNFQWKNLNTGVEWFDERSSNVPVLVQDAP